MFRSRVTLEQYLKSVEHEAAAGKDISLDDINMDLDLEEEEEVEINEREELDTTIWTNINPAHIIIPEDFKDDHEVLIIDDCGNARKSTGRISVHMVYKLVSPERIMVPLNNFLQPIKKAGSLFNRFVADITKRSSICPLNYDDWRLVPQYFKGRIIIYIRKMFMLPDGVEVNRKVLSAVREKVRGYKYALRCKYVKEDTTKEALYNLDISKRPSNISDQMWVGLVDHFFSDKFQKFSKNGKMARGKQLHPHTGGSESFAIKRDKFETKHHREPGPIEWFVKTRERKDHSYHEPETQKFVDCAFGIIKRKTGSSEVEFSAATKSAETYAYQKLMGPECNGRIRGVGNGVAPSKFRSGIRTSESTMISMLLKEVKSLQQEVAHLKSSQGDPKIGHFEEDNTRNSCLQGGDKENAQMDQQRGVEDILNDIGNSKDANNNTRTSPNQIEQIGDFEEENTIDSSLHNANIRPNPKIQSRLIEIENSSVLGDKCEMRHTSGLQIGHHTRHDGGKENVQVNSIRGNMITMPQMQQFVNKLKGSKQGCQSSSLTSRPSGQFKLQGANEQIRQERQMSETQLNPLHGLNMSKNHMGKGDVVVPAGMKNSMVLGVEGAGPNTNATGSSKQAYNNVSRLSQIKASNLGCEFSGLSRMPSSLLRAPNSVGGMKPVNEQTRKEANISNADLGVKMLSNQRIHMQQKQNQSRPMTTPLARVEIEKLVDKVLKDNPDTVRSFRNPKKRDFAHCYLGGSAMTECKQRANPELLDKVLWEKLFDTIKPISIHHATVVCCGFRTDFGTYVLVLRASRRNHEILLMGGFIWHGAAFQGLHS